MKTVYELLAKIARPPFLFKVSIRSITQSGGTKDYWTLPDTMEPIRGYTRIPILYGTTDGSVGVVGTVLSSNSVQAQTFNYAGTQKTVTIFCLFLWVRDDLIGGGYCIVSLLCAISSFVRRWSHEQENYRPAEVFEVFDRYVLKYSDKYNVRDSGIVCGVSDNRRFKRRIYACWNYWNESKSWRLVSSSSVFERFKSSIELLQSWNSGVHGSSKRHNGNSIVQEGTVALEGGCC